MLFACTVNTTPCLTQLQVKIQSDQNQKLKWMVDQTVLEPKHAMCFPFLVRK